MAMSETRPPITAGPIARPFKLLKRTSVNWTGVDAADVGTGAGAADEAGVTEEAAEGVARTGGGETIGANSCS